MREKGKITSMTYKYRWSLFFLLLAVVLALPAVLIVSNPLLHAAGIKELSSASDNMAGSTSGQQGAMGSTAASGVAGAAAAGASSDPSPMKPLDPKTSQPMHTDEDGDTTGGPPRTSRSSSSKSSGSSGGSGDSGGDDSGFFPKWLTDLLG